MQKNEAHKKTDSSTISGDDISSKYPKPKSQQREPLSTPDASAMSHKFPFIGQKRQDRDPATNSLSQEIYDEYIQLRSEFLEYREKYDNSSCVNIGIQLNSTAVLLTEIYEYDPQYYYEALSLITSAYRKSKQYDVAEINLKKMKLGLKKLIGSQKCGNQVLYNYYIMCLKEFVVLYASMQNFNAASKYEEFLLGENQEFFQLEDAVEMKLAKAMILRSSNKFDQAITILEDIKAHGLELLSDFVVVSLLTELASLYNYKGNVEAAVYEINNVIHTLKDTGLANTETKTAFIEAFTIKISYLTDFVKKIDINNQSCDFDEEYKELKTDIKASYAELASFILAELQSKETLLEENLYINPIHKYILYLGKTKDFKLGISLCDETLAALRKYCSNFNKYVGYTFELKARLLAKKRDINKARENYQAAYDIFINLNDRNKGAHLKKSLDNLTKA